MKYFYTLSILLFILAFSSCSSEDAIMDEPQEEYITYSFAVGGEFELLESQFKSSQSDLFGIQIYDVRNNVPYSYVVGDDVSKISIDLRRDWEYKIVMTYLKDGKNLIKRDTQQEKWGSPFGTKDGSETVLNKLYYGDATIIDWLSHGSIEQKDGNIISYPAVDRYHGVKNFTATDANNEISMFLKKMVFGLRIEVDLGEKNSIDEVVFTNATAGRKYNFDLVNGKGVLEFSRLSLNFDLEEHVKGDYAEDMMIGLGTPNLPKRFFYKKISIKRNTMHTVRYNADIDDGSTSETADGNLKIGLEDVSMNEELYDFSEED